jgi:4-hydroxybenzoate polyprenyltransferase
MYGCGVLIGIIVEGGSSYEAAIFGFFTAFFIQAGTFALNDYCDLESDIANRRLDRPLVRGDITKAAALLVACVATALGIVFAVLLTVLRENYLLFLLAFMLAVLGILYDIKMKEFFAVSNFYIAFTMAYGVAYPFVHCSTRGFRKRSDEGYSGCKRRRAKERKEFRTAIRSGECENSRDWFLFACNGNKCGSFFPGQYHVLF